MDAKKLKTLEECNVVLSYAFIGSYSFRHFDPLSIILLLDCLNTASGEVDLKQIAEQFTDWCVINAEAYEATQCRFCLC